MLRFLLSLSLSCLCVGALAILESSSKSVPSFEATEGNNMKQCTSSRVLFMDSARETAGPALPQEKLGSPQDRQSPLVAGAHGAVLRNCKAKLRSTCSRWSPGQGVTSAAHHEFFQPWPQVDMVSHDLSVETKRPAQLSKIR